MLLFLAQVLASATYCSDQPQCQKTRPLTGPLIRCALSETCRTSYKKTNQLQQTNKAKQRVGSSCSEAEKHLGTFERSFYSSFDSNELFKRTPDQVNKKITCLVFIYLRGYLGWLRGQSPLSFALQPLLLCQGEAWWGESAPQALLLNGHPGHPVHKAVAK